jgi:hypothetical protein
MNGVFGIFCGAKIPKTPILPARRQNGAIELT